VLALSACSAALAAESTPTLATPSAGRYVNEGGSAELTVQPPAQGDARFALETVGANGHSCALEGTVRQGRAVLETVAGEPPCKLGFAPLPQGFRIKELSDGVCRFFCGARAGFEFDYLPLPADCEAGQVQRQRQQFLRHYKARQYREAQPVLQNLLQRCERLLYWTEVGQICNDLAITQYHLGDKAACRATLAPVAKVATRNRDTLQANLPPLDFEIYLPIAQATWHNLKLCQR
jgi:hypothetical protein